MTNALKKHSMLAAFLTFFVLLVGTSFASGTGDALGLASTWVKVQTWFADPAVTSCKKRMNLATNNGNTWSDKTVLFGH